AAGGGVAGVRVGDGSPLKCWNDLDGTFAGHSRRYGLPQTRSETALLPPARPPGGLSHSHVRQPGRRSLLSQPGRPADPVELALGGGALGGGRVAAAVEDPEIEVVAAWEAAEDPVERQL